MPILPFAFTDESSNVLFFNRFVVESSFRLWSLIAMNYKTRNSFPELDQTQTDREIDMFRGIKKCI